MVQAWAAVMYGVKGLSSYTALGSVVGPKGEKEYLFRSNPQNKFAIDESRKYVA